MPQIRISVITVCFNAASTIERTIQSVCSQIDADSEYIVIDGGSTDGTVEILARYEKRIDCMVLEKDDGIFDAMNKGVGLATGDVIYFLNADDRLVDARVLADITCAFKDDEDRALVYGNVVLENEPNGVRMFPARAFRQRTLSEFLHNSFCHQAVFVRRSLFDRLGLFDRSYKYSADYEWIIRAFKLNSGRDFHFVDREIAYYSCLGQSNQHLAVTRKEVMKMQFKHFSSFEYFWYFFRYVFIRRLKKRMLNEAT